MCKLECFLLLMTSETSEIGGFVVSRPDGRVEATKGVFSVSMEIEL